MRKIYRIFFLLIVFVFLTTFNPRELDLQLKKNNKFFEVKNIILTNNFLTKKDEIQNKLSKIYGKNIFLIRRSDVEEPLKKINFMKKIEVKKKYPDTIIIKIYETKPIAFFFKNKSKYLLDSSSNLISFDDSMKFRELPSIFGEGAENNFIYFFKKLKDNNFPEQKIKNFYYFQIGRWDLQLLDDKIIKFPNKNTDSAIKKSVELLNRTDFKNYKIIDLRVDGKIIVE